MRERCALISLGCTVLLAQLTPSGASAEDRFSIENLAPATSQRTSIISVYGTETLDWGEWELNVLGAYADEPLEVEDANGKRLGDIVGSIGQLNLMGTVGITSFLDLSVALPLHRATEGTLFPGAQRGISLNNGNSKSGEPDTGLGDLRFVARARLLQQGGFGVAAVGSLFLPTGKENAFMGEAVRVEPRLAIDYATGGLRLAGNVGYLFRHETDYIPGNQIDDAMTWGAGVDAPLVSVLHAVAEVDGWLGLAAGGANQSQAPMEWRAGPRIVYGGWLAQLGAGTALVRGIGAPSVRVYASVGYSGMDTDGDDDGIDDAADRCPEAAEDKDGFNDTDGCPEDDNDGDGVRDATDGAPNDAEDKDGFADADGVPDLDNDGDGVLDVNDRAPNDAEDKDGFEDADGAPDLDNDADGVPDATDKCPLVAGAPEDSGCAAKDSDIDGTNDRDDKCPSEAGPAANNGCPMVQVTATKLEISDKVYFDLGSDVIQQRSFALLDAVAQSLASHPEVKAVSVEGHSDTTGKPEKNLQLSARRAASVVKYLVEKGVDQGRLRSRGFGQTKPLASNDTDEGKSQNRRVEFVIANGKDSAGAAPKPAKPDAEPARAP